MDMTFSGGEGPSVDLLKETETLYREVAEELALAMRGVRQGEVSDAKAAMQAVKDLRIAFQMVMDERTRVEKLRKQVAGVVRDHALDFDAARSEIGRRLARLRDAGGC
ncbi:hypothetical protein OE699_06600 [Sedimentimonas flavescens]|uniref:Uncharacterized protein n=2 Tax=Rhodobacter group TaxID=3374108 RepID=A0ABT2ZZ06_9RHOB|nr:MULTISPECIES: hypothetical protein [Paracoccaceae]WBL34413.1 hypothetical protein O5O51_06840 [Sinirhodobacter sp. HNIBRBA609]MBW0157282.1 hypothetical protein [Sedimentimonas flavescens]MCE5972082.1 hypothetical protein [Sinirhodobacter sp. WL0062]MCT2538554.1 hypothetical protein [Sedimentimonas flavescens]MCV2878520.1 hypothetical protein [Sedimentimonas flavescens]